MCHTFGFSTTDAQALAAVLAGGAAPNLIDLDLRDNPIDKEAESLLVRRRCAYKKNVIGVDF